MTKENTTDIKTHWLYSPNKNYFGHQDLPNGEDVVLTIKSAQWGVIKNHITGSSEEKRIIEFKEDYKWLKPFLCNETNAQAIFKVTEKKFMEETTGKKIKIGHAKTKMIHEMKDCLRVKNVKSSLLESASIDAKQVKILNDLAEEIGFDISKVCQGYKIKDISALPLVKFDAVLKGLEKKRGSV